MPRYWLLVGALLWTGPTGSAGQIIGDADPIARRIQGCYALHLETQAEWLSAIERRIHLTPSELLGSNDDARVFVMRAAPGEKASWHPSLSWTVTGDEVLQISWSWPGFEYITGTFRPLPASPEEELSGSISFWSDNIPVEPWPEVPVTLERIDCIAPDAGEPQGTTRLWLGSPVGSFDPSRPGADGRRWRGAAAPTKQAR